MRQQTGAYTPHKTVTARPYGRIGARAVGSFVPKLTRTAFEKFGFSTAALLTDWAQIVGPSLAKTTMPDRIRWPKSAHQEAASGGAGPRGGATLHISVDPALALDIQYKTQIIIDRINGYFGYRAVGELRIIQASLAQKETPPAAKPKALTLAQCDPVVATIADDGLRAALERMQQGMLSRRG